MPSWIDVASGWNSFWLIFWSRSGAVISGTTPDQTYVEIVEIPDHPYFLGCQFHPEFKSKPLEPHPLFHEFIKAGYRHRLQRSQIESVASQVVQ